MPRWWLQSMKPNLEISSNSSPEKFPRFDLILLGMGPDGHTASLFPDSQGLKEQSRLVIANWVEKFKTHRISFTFPVLNRAAEVMFLASGPDKVRHAAPGSGRHEHSAFSSTKSNARRWDLAVAA